MMFFLCKTVEEVKKLYRELSMHLHPDHGGCSRLFALLQDAKDNMIGAIGLIEDLNSSEGFKSDSMKYEKQTDDIYYGDPKLEIIEDFRKYKKKSPKFNLMFLESLEEFLEQKSYLTASQYNCLVKTYYSFKMWEKLQE